MDHYVRVGSAYFAPKCGKVFSKGEEVRKEVRREAAVINGTTMTDITTLKSMMGWAKKATKQTRTTVWKDLCTWEACEQAIAKGFKRGKGLGVDGFDGYLIRLLPRRMQRRYWTILRGIARTEQYPTEWNEWIAVLANKPGEDPKTLERRRDLWLQCHSMKCMFRMILPVYEGVAEACVGTWQAGWTKGRMAAEQTLVARLMGEQRMRERTMSCR